MKVKDQVLSIISLARDFGRPGNNQSVYHLLQSTGYFINFHQIDIATIQVELRAHPEVIEDWLEWSENKRSAGWYFKSEGRKSVVGFYSGSKDEEAVSYYLDLSEACATFIKNEIEAIRNN